MTYHATAGKGGTRNSARTKHIDEYAPNFNKSQGSGVNRRGRKENNPSHKPRERSAWDAIQEWGGDKIVGQGDINPPRGFKSRKWKGGTKLGDVRRYNMR